MAAKRFFDDSDDKDQDTPNDKRIRPNRPSFASVIGEVVMVKNLQNLFSGLEPLLRRVVNEEVERAIRHSYPAGSMMMTRSPSLRIEAAAAAEQAPKYALVFRKKLCLPIFTGSRVLDSDGSPIQVMLVDVDVDDGNKSEMGVPTSLPQPVKLELVVLDGDFPPNERSWWGSEEFNRYIVKERSGKRPLLAGELSLTLRDGHAPLNGDIDFTDNSSWIRSRKFRLAARVVAAPDQPPRRIREAISEPFVVKDHRGELYKKHHPPMLQDEVWRLEKIGKDGAFHKKLSAEGINSVQEFLKLSVVDPHRLRKILGVGMSEKMWDVTIKHAKTCNMGNKLYVYRGPNCTIYLNPICQLVRADISGQTFPGRDLNNINRSYIERLVREAYGRWSNLEEIDGVLNDNINNVAFLAQGETSEQFENNYDQSNYFGDKSTEVAAANYVQNNNNAQIECSEWPVNAAAFATSSFGNGIPYSFPGSQSDGDITPPGSGSVIDGGVSRWNFA